MVWFVSIFPFSHWSLASVKASCLELHGHLNWFLSRNLSLFHHDHWANYGELTKALLYLYILLGGLEHLDYFSIYWECHHPNGQPPASIYLCRLWTMEITEAKHLPRFGNHCLRKWYCPSVFNSIVKYPIIPFLSHVYSIFFWFLHPFFSCWSRFNLNSCWLNPLFVLVGSQFFIFYPGSPFVPEVKSKQKHQLIHAE